MHKEQVEIYSDKTNAAVMRHPGRRFPGSLIQGDDLYALCRLAEEAHAGTDGSAPGFGLLTELRNRLRARLNDYKEVLGEHGIPMPFSE